MHIQSLAQQFCDHCIYIKGYSKLTTRRYKRVIKLYCKFAQIEYLNEANQDNVKSFLLNGRTIRNWNPSTFISYYNGLLVFFRWCVKENYLVNNPVVDIEIPKQEKKIPTKLTKQQSLKILEVTYNLPYYNRFLQCRNHAILAVFLYAGLRRAEVLHLRFTDIDVENLTIFVNQGKGKKDRIIPMSSLLAQILRRYLDERKRLNKTCSEFFTSFTCNRGCSQETIKRLVVVLRKVSGIPFTCHKLRHTFATLMLEGGCDIYSLSKMMGHSDIKTTTIYLAASAEHLRTQMTKHPLNDLRL